MLTPDNNKLDVLDNFIVDKSLPKYNNSNEDSLMHTNNNFVINGSVTSADNWVVGTNSLGNTPMIKTQTPFINRIIRWFIKVTAKRKLTVQEFFDEIKSMLIVNSTSFEPKYYDDRVSAYKTALANSINAGQTALTESIQEKLDIFKLESVLFGVCKCVTITEDQIIQFYMASERGLRLDWIKNFNRVIPKIIVDKKLEIDKLHVFDNYVIMHYDPNTKAFKKTKSDIEKEKDPILFGVIQNSNKLYYIADWIDEYCDLTLDVLVEKFGEDAIRKNNITAKFK